MNLWNALVSRTTAVILTAQVSDALHRGHIWTGCLYAAGVATILTTAHLLQATHLRDIANEKPKTGKEQK